MAYRITDVILFHSANINKYKINIYLLKEIYKLLFKKDSSNPGVNCTRIYETFNSCHNP